MERLELVISVSSLMVEVVFSFRKSMVTALR
jgi:hypothetical protein